MNKDYAVVIPCYRHGHALKAVLKALAVYKLKIYVVDDGNDAEEKKLLCEVTQANNVALISLKKNSGKGAAVYAGAKQALTDKFTYIIQIDADGQHCLADLEKLISLSNKYPHDLISAQPVYDQSIPKSRLYGRYITHFWVWVETLSFNLKDSMCGFRIYPLKELISCIEQEHPGMRMDFDTEIMVRLFWRGTKTHFLKSPVTYPQDGISNFDALKDNLAISLMHSKLCMQMPYRLLKLYLQKSLFKPEDTISWERLNEVHGLLGMKIMMRLYQVFGRSFFMLCLPLIIAGYYITALPQKKASQKFLQLVNKRQKQLGMKISSSLSTFAHFLSFGITLLDKLSLWSDETKVKQRVEYAPGAEEILATHGKRGKLILASHLGNLDAARALAQKSHLPRVTALVFTDNAARFLKITRQFAPDALQDLIAVQKVTAALPCELDERLANGEYVALTADRLSPCKGRGGERCIYVPFLGRTCAFPQGPFVLASLLKCEVVVAFALKEHKKIRIYAHKFDDTVNLRRNHREDDLKFYAAKYASILEKYALSHPYEWFNFYEYPWIKEEN